MDSREDPGNPYRFKVESTDRSKVTKRAEVASDGLTGMSAEQADWEQGLDDDDGED